LAFSLSGWALPNSLPLFHTRGIFINENTNSKATATTITGTKPATVSRKSENDNKTTV